MTHARIHHLTITGSAKKLTALALVGTAVATGAAGTQALAARTGAGAVGGSEANRGNPNAVPPILPPAQASELAEIRATEALERRAFYYHLPASAPYSSAVFDVFNTQGGAGS
jgi:hypothetical protein